MTRELNQRRMRLVEKEAQVIQQKRLLSTKRESIKQRKQEIEIRKLNLNDSLERCDSGIEDLHENEQVLEKNVKMRQTIFPQFE